MGMARRAELRASLVAPTDATVNVDESRVAFLDFQHDRLVLGGAEHKTKRTHKKKKSENAKVEAIA